MCLRFPLRCEEDVIAPDLMEAAFECGVEQGDFDESVAMFLEGAFIVTEGNCRLRATMCCACLLFCVSAKCWPTHPCSHASAGGVSSSRLAKVRSALTSTNGSSATKDASKALESFMEGNISECALFSLAQE